VLIVMPVQTALALGLALVVSRRRLAGRGFFRTAYYFPSITSSVAVSILFLYVFGCTSVVNAIVGDLDTLTTGVGRLVSGQLGAGTQYPLQLAAAMAMTIPVAIVFFVFQKYIMRTGEGAMKE
jgi:multiple sugar transport system permease protein